MANSGVETEPAFLAALEALLEVLPISKQYGGDPYTGAVAEASNDFDALESMRRLAFAQELLKPQQLAMLDTPDAGA